MWQLHPALPDCKEATQFWVEVKHEQSEVLSKILEQGVNFDANLDMESAAKIADKMEPLEFGLSSSSFGTDAGVRSVVPQVIPKQLEAQAKAGAKAAAKVKRERDRAERKAQELAAREEARRLQVEEKDTPKGRAKEWLKGCANTMEQLRDLKVKMEGTLQDASDKTFWGAKLQKHINDVKSLRDSIDEAMQPAGTSGTSSATIAEHLSRAGTLMKKIRDDKLLLTSAMKKAQANLKHLTLAAFVF